MDERGDLAVESVLVLSDLPDAKSTRPLLAKLALKLGLDFTEVSRLTRALPARILLQLDPGTRSELEHDLQEAGAVHAFEPPSEPGKPCPRHDKLGATGTCTGCGTLGCQLCLLDASNIRKCPSCRAQSTRKRRFFLIRVSLLSSILVVVLLWALGDVLSRSERNDWQRPVNVALVLVTRDEVSGAAARALGERVSDLEEILEREARHHGVRVRPFEFVFYGPTRAGPAPEPPEGDELWPLVRHAYQQWRYVRAIDGALDIPSSAWDSRIYIVAETPRDARMQFVEGYGQAGGRIGIVEVELTEGMVDAVLAVAAHELFHTLGASDKYDGLGRTRVPEGLARPKMTPRFPQSLVEVMARGRPLDERGHETQLEHVEELAVGSATAREIGWRKDGD